MMNDNTIVHLVKHLDVTDLAGEKVMIDFATGKYFLLKGSANEIWDMLDQDVTISEIRNSLMNIYDVDEPPYIASCSRWIRTDLLNSTTDNKRLPRMFCGSLFYLMPSIR